MSGRRFRRDGSPIRKGARPAKAPLMPDGLRKLKEDLAYAEAMAPKPKKKPKPKPAKKSKKAKPITRDAIRKAVDMRGADGPRALASRMQRCNNA